jgi:transposase
VRLWPSPRANGEHTIDVVRRLRAEGHERQLIVLGDGAPDHRANAVREVATTLGIELMPRPGYSPDRRPVEALWRWLREDVTSHHCQASAEDLTRRVAEFEARLNRDPFVVADRLWVKDHLDPDEEKLRFSNQTRFKCLQLLLLSCHSELAWGEAWEVAAIGWRAARPPWPDLDGASRYASRAGSAKASS